MAIVARIRLRTDSEGKVSFEYGEYSSEIVSEVMADIECEDVPFDAAEWSCKFDSLCEVGQPYVPWFEALLKTISGVIRRTKDEEECLVDVRYGHVLINFDQEAIIIVTY